MPFGQPVDARRGTPGRSSTSSRCPRPSPRPRCPRRARGCARRGAGPAWRTGASVKPQLPMTTLVTPCQHEQVPSGSQKTWASMCVCPSTNPGATTWPSASITSRADSRMRPIAAIRPADDADVAPISGHAGTVDHHAVLDHQVIGHARLLSSRRLASRSNCVPPSYLHLDACPPAAARQQLSAPPFFGRSISSTRTSSGAHMKQMRGPLGIWMGPSSSRAPSPSRRVMSASRPAESKPKCSRP